tara:strand:+ start:3554 stop:4135 length:582 start_codon:yes stop_codon:yes gene_type:complete
MPITMPIAIAAMAAVSAAGIVATTVNSQMAAKAQKKQAKKKFAADQEYNRVTQKKADLQTSRSRVAALREARIKRAQIVQGTANAGLMGGGSSSTQGALASNSSQLGQNIGMLGQFEGLSGQLSLLSQQSATALSKFNRIGAKADSLNSIFSGVASVANAGIGAMGGISGIQSPSKGLAHLNQSAGTPKTNVG